MGSKPGEREGRERNTKWKNAKTGRERENTKTKGRIFFVLENRTLNVMFVVQCRAILNREGEMKIENNFEIQNLSKSMRMNRRKREQQKLKR